jgi:hypothetical protein
VPLLVGAGDGAVVGTQVQPSAARMSIAKWLSTIALSESRYSGRDGRK